MNTSYNTTTTNNNNNNNNRKHFLQLNSKIDKNTVVIKVAPYYCTRIQNSYHVLILTNKGMGVGPGVKSTI